jgi:hypothetical protein
MTDKKTAAIGPKPTDAADPAAQGTKADAPDAPHTEVSPQARAPQPRSKVMPPDLDGDDDDMFNDMPV